MGARANGKRRDVGQLSQDTPGQAVPPSIGDIWDARASWIARIGDALTRFPENQFIVLTTLLSLVGTAVLLVWAGTGLTTAALIGVLAVAVLITGFGGVALMASRKHAATRQNGGNQPPQS